MPRRPTSPVDPLRRFGPLRSFLATESAGAVLLAIAAFAALVAANSPLADRYSELFDTPIRLSVGSAHLGLSTRGWINDGLMALFFLVAGMEIKRELVEGELVSWRRAALPALAAIGGMVVPALLFAAFTVGRPGGHAWGVPMATDIALALGVLAALGRRVTPGAKVFLLALAIVDDLGAILLIAFVYSTGVHWVPLLGASVVAAIVFGLARIREHWTIGFVVLGVLLWLLLHEAGVHATMAGVVMGLAVPARPRASWTWSTRPMRRRRARYTTPRSWSRRHAVRSPDWNGWNTVSTRGRACWWCRCSRSRTPASPSAPRRSATPPTHRLRGGSRRASWWESPSGSRPPWVWDGGSASSHRRGSTGHDWWGSACWVGSASPCRPWWRTCR
ncbi:MAG: Na+/H+ antiporter NhaA [Microthrixaceae bacterium]